MQPHPHSNQLKRKKRKWKQQWKKVGARLTGLYLYRPSGMFYARVRTGGKVYGESLKTKDLAFAKRKLDAFKKRLDRTDPRFGKITFVRWLEVYLATLSGTAGADKAKRRIVDRIKRGWFGASRLPMREIRQSEVLTFLNKEYGGWTASYWNSALALIRHALERAVDDGVIVQNPAGKLKYRKRQKPIRLSPTFEQFLAIVADIRAQPFNRDAEDSGDFVEFMGLAGLGQAEVSGIKREHVDLESGRIALYRRKTSSAFTIPIFPQVRALVEKLCAGKKAGARLFAIDQARKALRNACKRLGYPQFTQRSLRRCFITRAIERGVDIKVISQWQGHVDGGTLILKVYSHVRPEHSNRMAQLMSAEQPANVIELKADQHFN